MSNRPFSTLPIESDSFFCKDLIAHVNASFLEHTSSPQTLRVSHMEESLSGLMLVENLLMSDLEANTKFYFQNFSFILPMRGVDDQGHSLCFLLTAQVGQKKQSATPVPTKLPDLRDFGVVRWHVARDIAQLNRLADRHAGILALLEPLQKSLDLNWFFSTSKIEKELLEKETQSGSVLSRSSL